MVIKIQKLKGEVSPFAGISFVNCLFDKSGLSDLIDSELGLRVKFFGYQYSEIFRNLRDCFDFKFKKSYSIINRKMFVIKRMVISQLH